MHIRNKYYNNPPDFLKLASAYPSLKKYIKFNHRSATINFKDPRACRELTYALLWCDFHIRLEIPLDSLCPVIPGRLDYIHWIEDLIENNDNITSTTTNINNNIDNNNNSNNNNENNNEINNKDNNKQIKGIDIGTGASCIYPLLACKLHSNWTMEALELNERSYEYAKNNIERNNMKNQIHIRKVKNEQDNSFSIIAKKNKTKWKELTLFNDISKPHLFLENKIKFKELMDFLILPDYDFCMCNPPFYSSEIEMEQCKDIKIEEPHSVCTGSKNEMLTEGGEIQFISKIIDDSIQQYKKKKKAIKKLLKLNKNKEKSNLINEKILKKILSKHGLTVLWYTSLIGKKSSVEPLTNYLKSKNYIKDIKTESFKQGKTVRWAIAWTFKSIKY